ncbi:MAG: hypothetical protein AMJ78_06320 [Omnitrophica WOR_2 bacterium SM23_29]|nr:MAG: hypothetical protein AMJ78_06320 [Omnitrophica WOR_2 bacterium SM23_29]
MKFEGSFKNSDAQNIIYRAFIPEGPLGSVIFVHGLGEHSLKYDAFAERFYKRDIAAFSYDQRGHGRSEGRRGHVNRLEELVEDLRQFVDIVKVQTPRRDIYLIGQSLGGLLSIIFAIKYNYKIKGVVASSPALRIKNPPNGVETAVAKMMRFFVPALTVCNRVPFEDISHDERAILETKADKLSHRLISVKLYFEMMDAMRYAFDNVSKIKAPILLLHGTDDRVADVDATRKFYEGITSSDKEIKLYPKLYHELFREVNKDEIQEHVLNWVLRRAT